MPEYVENPWINPNTIEKREYQESIVETALSDNTLCVLPTGLGKTSIAALVVANILEKKKNAKILFMAPTRPLVEQHKKTFEKIFKLGLNFEVVTGQNKPSERYKIYERADIVFSTPQTIENDIKKDRIDLSKFSLIIFDEAHRCIGNYAYVYIAKKYVENSNGLILALTASPGGHRSKINLVKNLLFIKNIEIRTREDKDVIPYIQPLKQEWVNVELSQPLKSIREYLEKSKDEKIKMLVNWNIIKTPVINKTQIIELQQKLSKSHGGFKFAALSVLAQILKIDHALLLLETQCIYSLKKYFDKLITDASKRKTRAVERLVREIEIKNAMRLTNELYNEGKEHPKIDKLVEVVNNQIKNKKDSRIIIFAQFRDTINKIYKTLKEIPDIKPVEFIGQAKKYGKGLSQKEQIKILNEFKMGIYNVLIASQVGEEGLDVTETDLVIFYEAVPSAIRKIQRSGRTARTRPGKVVILITKGTRDEAFHWAGYQKERKMKKVLKEMQKGQLTLSDIVEK